MIKKRIISFFTVNNRNKVVVFSLVISFIVGFVSYNAFIVYGFNSPDGILEGFHYYTDQYWAIAGCGRWFLVLLNILHANLVFPWLTIMECIIVNWLSAHTLCKIFKIEKQSHYYLICALFVVIPTYIEMFTYTNSAFSYCVSVLFSILFVYFNLYNNKCLSILSSVLLGCAMGSYQSQIGIAVGLTIMCLIYKVLNKENDKLKFFVMSLISGILGLVIYIIGLEVFLKIYYLELYSRAATFSVSAVFTNFIPRFIYTYQVFFNTFNQIILKRQIIFIIIFIVLIIELAVIMFRYIKNKEYMNTLFLIILVLLLPPSLNIIGIILPKEPISHMMLTPNYLIIPFTIGLTKYVLNKTEVIICYALCLCVCCLTWTYVLSANATYDSYRLSCNVYKTQFSNAMNRVLELDEYQTNSTRIVVIGHQDDSKLREQIHTYKYAINLYDNLLYWGNPELDPRTTSIYIANEFGIDPGIMEYDEYKEIIKLQECLEMPCWPTEGSIKMINNCAVIKFSEVYE